jgi:hypothetical protein
MEIAIAAAQLSAITAAMELLPAESAGAMQAATQAVLVANPPAMV